MPDAVDLFGGAGGAAVGLHLLGLTEHGSIRRDGSWYCHPCKMESQRRRRKAAR